MTLTEKQKKLYVDSGGLYCPYCGSDNLVTQEYSPDGEVVIQGVYCYECQKSWSDVFRLVGIHEHD